MVVVARNIGLFWNGMEVSPPGISYDRVVSMLVIKGTISEEICTFASPVIIQPSITHTSGAVFAEV